MTDCDAILAGIVSDPLEETRWLVLADWLEEFDDPQRAELLRLHRKMLATCCEPDSHPERAAWQARMVELLVAGVRPCVPQETLTLPGGVPMTFSFIPPGSFLMGSIGWGGPESVRPVEVTQGVFMGVYPVTQTQWAAVTGADPSHFKGPERPVESVSWRDCREFCTRLSERTGRTVELPTEAEWESACRAGTTTGYHFGDAIDTTLANYNGRYMANASSGCEDRQQTTGVGSFPANPWGLCDVHGNVWELCAGRFGPNPAAERDDQRGPSNSPRVTRGGSWGNTREGCEAGARMPTGAKHRNNCCGLRVCFRPD